MQWISAYHSTSQLFKWLVAHAPHFIHHTTKTPYITSCWVLLVKYCLMFELISTHCALIQRLEPQEQSTWLVSSLQWWHSRCHQPHLLPYQNQLSVMTCIWIYIQDMLIGRLCSTNNTPYTHHHLILVYSLQQGLCVQSVYWKDSVLQLISVCRN